MSSGRESMYPALLFCFALCVLDTLFWERRLRSTWQRKDIICNNIVLRGMALLLCPPFVPLELLSLGSAQLSEWRGPYTYGLGTLLFPDRRFAGI